MTNEDRTTLAALIVQMCRELLAANGEPFEIALGEPALTEGNEPLLTASIGLGRPDLRGALVVVARPALFQATFPAELAGTGQVQEQDLADWAGELSNQLLGRLKNRLCHLGLDFSVGSPIVVHGDRLHLRVGDGPDALGCKLRVRNERMDVYIEVIREDGNALLSAGAHPVTASPEGDTVLF
jgi:chemotaxis protein CheX